MKLNIILLFLGFAVSAHAQAFQNLNFESATIPPSTPVNSFIPSADALPDWTAYFTSGGLNYPQSQLGYDFISGGGNVISIIDKHAPVFTPLNGNYSAFLFGGIGDGEGNLYSASINQTGLVPGGTESLLFDAYVFGAPFTVTLGGQNINMTPLATFGNYTEYGGNIPPSLAGQSETLTLTEPPAPLAQSPSGLELDNISFSQTAVTPEPSPILLTGVGGLIFALHRRFRQRTT